jgi:hypothetical protein
MIKEIKKSNFILILFFLLLLVVVFRELFFKGKIPFSSNLLVSFYQPWASEVFPGWEHGIPNKPLGIDNLRIFYPQRIFTNQLIKVGEIPFWNPYNFAGNVHLANSQTAVFYPLFLLFYFLDPIFVWSLMVILQPLLTAIFTYLFLKILTKDFLASLFGAFVFAFCGFMVVRWEDGLVIGHAALWLPFILFSLEKYALFNKKRWFLLSVFGLLSSLLAGWFQVSFYVWLISFLYWLFRISSVKFNSLLKRIKIMVGPFLVAIFLGSFHLFSVAEVFLVSPRGLKQPKEFLDTFLTPWYHLITFLAPDFFGNPGAYNFFGKAYYQETILYVGLVPLTLALWVLIRLWKKERLVRFFGLLGISSLFLGFNFSITRWFLSLPLPILSSFLPSRIFFINSFCFSILSAFGFSSLMKTKKDRGLKVILGMFLLALLIVGSYAGLSWADETGHLYSLVNWVSQCKIKLVGLRDSKIMIRNLVLPIITLLSFVVLLIMQKILKKGWLAVGIFILTIFSQLYFTNKFLYFSERQFVFPPHSVFQFLKENSGYDRFWSWGEGYITSNFATYYQLYSPEGVDAMYPIWYGELLSAVGKKGRISEEIPRIEPRITVIGEGKDGWNNPYRLKLLSLLGVKYIVGLKSEKLSPPEDLFQSVWENDKWRIWEYNEAWPRAFWVGGFVERKEKQEIADLIFNQKFPLVRKVILSEPLKGFWQFEENGKGKVEIVSYKPNEIIFQIEANQDGFIFLSDVYYPGWNVFIDGKKGKIYQANYAFRATPVSGGNHRVVFQYSPKSFKYGIVISLMTLAGLIFWITSSKIKNNNANQI